MKRFLRGRVWLISAVLLGFMAWTTAVWAHGGGELVVGKAEVGPYFVSVWVNPPDPTTDAPVHLTVGVADSADNAPVLDAAVQVTVRDAETGSAVATANATTEASTNRLFYETDVALGVGNYTAIVNVLGSEGSGDVDFDLVVADANPINWLWLGLGGLAVVLVLVVWRSRASAE